MPLLLPRLLPVLLLPLPPLLPALPPPSNVSWLALLSTDTCLPSFPQVNISSMASQQTITRVCGYSASKAAIDNFTKWLAVEMAQKLGDKGKFAYLRDCLRLHCN